MTEKLSEMIARPYLRTPRSLIIQTTALARRKRHEFVRAVSKGLVPPETPPSQRRSRKRRFPSPTGGDMMEDVSFSTQGIAQHRRRSWIYPHVRCIGSVLFQDSCLGQSPSDGATCSRSGCGRPRSKNSQLNALQNYCSIRCAVKSSVGDDGR